ncbi:MAG TPA: hypothetical protein DCW42_02875 [Bacteroidetes bacterium]|nr:hypothetical protein [Bacteroidota bacterium]
MGIISVHIYFSLICCEKPLLFIHYDPKFRLFCILINYGNNEHIYFVFVSIAKMNSKIQMIIECKSAFPTVL